jgi:hypothetical protein
LANPPENAFDDHFKPVKLIMQTGKIPAKDACFQYSKEGFGKRKVGEAPWPYGHGII